MKITGISECPFILLYMSLNDVDPSVRVLGMYYDEIDPSVRVCSILVYIPPTLPPNKMRISLQY